LVPGIKASVPLLSVKVAKVAPKDLPWEDEEDEKDETPVPKANYALKTEQTKTSKSAKFDALFDDEDDSKSPF
jgi:hypothetical protein